LENPFGMVDKPRCFVFAEWQATQRFFAESRQEGFDKVKSL